tara:strand:- start:46 stop:639 length:594 start_codon:yes stop_codon:yes gene_type:complete
MAFSCLHCGKTYGSSNAKTNHQRVCGLEKDLANEREENASLREELKQLRQELVKANARPTVQHINVLCFGSEPEVPEEVLQSILHSTGKEEAIAQYVRKRHFIKPGTKNIRIPNKAKNVAQVVKAVDGTKRWQDMSKSVVCDTLLERALEVFASLEHPTFNGFVNKVEDSKHAQERKKRKLYQDQIDSIERTIINHQ